MGKLVLRVAAVAASALIAPILSRAAAHAEERQKPVVSIPVGDLRLSPSKNANAFASRAHLAAN